LVSFYGLRISDQRQRGCLVWGWGVSELVLSQGRHLGFGNSNPCGFRMERMGRNGFV